jgi:hypothetical protein
MVTLLSWTVYVVLALCPRSGAHYTVSTDDVPGIERAILAVYRRYTMGSPMKVSAVGIEEYDRKVLSKRLAQTLSGVASYTGDAR